MTPRATARPFPPRVQQMPPPANVQQIGPPSLGLCLLVLAVGAGNNLDLPLAMRVPLSEFIAFCSIPFLFSRIRIGEGEKRLKFAIAILATWTTAILLSDAYNGFELHRFMRAFAKPLFCGFWMLFFVGIFKHNYRALIWFPVGIFIAALQNYFLPQSWTQVSMMRGGYDAIAYGIVPIITTFGVALSVLIYSKSRLLSIIFLTLTAIMLGLVGAPRSSMAIMLLNAAILGYMWFLKLMGSRPKKLTVTRLLWLILLAIGICYALFHLYVWLASTGYLGDGQQQKLIAQSKTKFGITPLGLIVAGRTEVFAAILAIIDNPLIGYGSWSGVTLGKYFTEAIYYVGTDARALDQMAAQIKGFSAGHSILFGGWMENGLLAAIALLSITYIAAKQFLTVVINDHRLAPWIIYISTNYFWHFLFSPFGVSSRMYIGLFLALYIVALLTPQVPRPFGPPPRRV